MASRLLLLPILAVALAACGDARPDDPDVGPVAGALIDATASLGDVDEGPDTADPVPEPPPEPDAAGEPENGAPAPPEPPEPPPPEDDGGVLTATWELLASFECELPELVLFEDEGEEEDEEAEPVAPPEIPDDVLALEGRTIAIEGYMLPLDWDDDGTLRAFLLSRHGMGCCFGVAPRPHEMIEVTMKTEQGALYEQYMPVLVTGKLSIHADGVRAEYLQCIYKMEGEAVAEGEEVR